MATTTPSSRLDHLKICMDCSGEGTRHVTDSGKGSLPIRRTVTCARCDGEGLIYVGPGGLAAPAAFWTHQESRAARRDRQLWSAGVRSPI